MYVNYKSVIVCGVVAGIFIGVSQIFSCCCWPVDLLILLASGAAVIHFSRGLIVEQREVLANGGIAGLIAGVIGGTLYSILSILTQVFATLMDFDYSTICGASYKPPTLLEAGAIGFICCLPTFVIAGIILGALGALLYTMLKPRNKPVDS